MVTNIDSNIGRLTSTLESAGLSDDTIVVFLTDNGPAFARYNAGMRGVKGSTYEGGIRVPCFLRWPGQLAAGREVSQVTAHIDLTPTLLDACRVPVASGPPLDGRSLMPLLRGGRDQPWPDRTICVQWHRGNAPEEGRNFAIRSGRYKLLSPDFLRPEDRPPLELYDLDDDPYERKNLAGMRPEMASRMYEDYRRWFRDVSSPRGFAAIPIQVGSMRENPTLLTRQDWRRRGAGNGPEGAGSWQLDVARAGRFEIVVEFPAEKIGQVAHLSIKGRDLSAPVDRASKHARFADLHLSAGPAELESWIDVRTVEARPKYVTITRVGDG